MAGVDRHTGRALTGRDHLSQSIADILTTPIGSRVLRRDYGSELPRLIDDPINPETFVDLYMASAEALAIWEPRIKLQRVQIADPKAASLVLIIDYEDLDGVFEQTSIDLGEAA